MAVTFEESVADNFMRSQSKILVDFLLTHGQSQDGCVLTCLLLVSDDPRLVDLINQKPERIPIKTDLVTRILDTCNADQISTILWTPLGLSLPPSIFKKYFAKAFASASELRTVYYLGGACSDYAMKHNCLLSVPETVGKQLRQSDDVDMRIIGRKLLIHSRVPIEVILNELMVGLGSKRVNEQVTSLYLIEMLIDKKRIRSFKQLTRGRYERMLELLSALSASRQKDTRLYAKRVMSLVQKIPRG